MSKIIRPEIGQRVLYWPSEYDLLGSSQPPMHRCDPHQPFDAGIVYVHGERKVNLIVTDHIGRTFSRPSVPLAQDGDSYPPGSGWFASLSKLDSEAPADPVFGSIGVLFHPGRSCEENKPFSVALAGRSALACKVMLAHSI